MKYIPTIGLEIHAELKTKTKMFCGCENSFDEGNPNTNICPICMAHPGALPMINKEAVNFVLRFGLAIGGRIPEHSQFDRKSYFYPDLPKGYQISQYEHPLVSGGELCGVRITRVHLEEDTARLLHELPGGKKSKNPSSFVDYNRAGVPLMELVTEPDMKTGEEVARFAKELQKILRYLHISDADMEKGHMRIEVNISLAPEGSKELGTKVEVKNINSFRSAGDAANFEIKRQNEALEKGEKIIQETRGWNDVKRVTVSQRTKESAHDYRYFPEPDLPPLSFSPEYVEEIREMLPELPRAKKERFEREYGISEKQSEVLCDDVSLANYFEEAVSELKKKRNDGDISLLVNYLTTDLKGIMLSEKKSIEEIKIAQEHLAHLIFLIQEGTISSRMAKDLLFKMHDSGEDPETIIKEEGMKFVSDDDALLPVIHEIIKDNEKAVLEYRSGRENAVQFLVGQGMAKMKGQADPKKLRELFVKHLS